MREPLRRLLLLPLLAPLLAVLLVGALQPRPPLRLRLLVWTTPALPAGAWLAVAGLVGAALSAGATALTLRSGPGSVSRDPWPSPGICRGSDRDPGRRAGHPPQSPPPQPPPRAPGDPPPTVSVPWRVVRRGSAAPGQPPIGGCTGYRPRALRNRRLDQPGAGGLVRDSGPASSA